MHDDNDISKRQISAIGERAAMGGYMPQYAEFARLIYESLIRRDLVRIRVADPEAGTLDDIFVETETEVHAYQMKWTINGGFVTFAYLMDLFVGLYESWVRIRRTYGGKRVYAHFVTCKELSHSDRIEDDAGNVLGSLEDFYNEAFLMKNAGKAYDPKWDYTFSFLKSELKDPTQFDDFIGHLIISSRCEVEMPEISRTRTSRRARDIMDIMNVIMRMAADPDRVVERTREQLIKDLRWEDRFRTKFNHSLHAPVYGYERIKKTFDELSAKLRDMSKGYIFLEGTPGSGKSTLLADWSDTIPNKVFSYYVFDFTDVSSSVANRGERGDVIHMLHDMVLMLDREGFPAGKEEVPHDDLDWLIAAFKKQLEELSDYYRRHCTDGTQEPYVIVVDGLDHITREYKPEKSLIKYLPSPRDLPEGVVIVLGSQYFKGLEGLNEYVSIEYKQENVIRMSSLTLEEVTKLTVEVGIDIGQDTVRKIYEKSQGHPLYVHYVIESLRGKDDTELALKDIPPYEDDIEVYYNRLFQTIRDNVGLIQFLGLVARISGAIRWDFLKEWGFDRNIYVDFVKYIKPLLICNDSLGEYYFFHNSFRQYLLNITMADPMTGKRDNSVEREFMSGLADYYLSSKVEPQYKANEYLYLSKRNDEFVNKTTPAAFEREMLDFRPIWEITRDVWRGVDIAVERHDVYLFLRYYFLLCEIDCVNNQGIPVLDFSDEFKKIPF